MSMLVGTFGARKIEEQFVPANTWTKVVCDQVLWNVANRYDPIRGPFVGKDLELCTFVAGVALRHEEAINTYDLQVMLYQNGEPRARLDSGAHLPMGSRLTLPLSWRNECEPDLAGECLCHRLRKRCSYSHLPIGRFTRRKSRSEPMVPERSPTRQSPSSREGDGTLVWPGVRGKDEVGDHKPKAAGRRGSLYYVCTMNPG